ncbi:MAG: hypothetical protein WAL04_13670, partial [Acidimicrobiales bacterium]
MGPGTPRLPASSTRIVISTGASVLCVAVLVLVSVVSSSAARAAGTGPQFAGSWSLQKAYPPFLLQVQSVSCPTTADCWAVGYGLDNAAVAATTDGGGTWT